MPPAPKPTASRDRDAKRRHQSKTTITGSDGEPIGPSLFELTRVPAKSWRRQTRQWFEAWRRSPQARLFVSGVEWESLGRCAYLVEQFYDAKTPASVKVQIWNAIRGFESLLGATHTDRVKTHMRIAAPDPSPKQQDGQGAKVIDYQAMVAGSAAAGS